MRLGVLLSRIRVEEKLIFRAAEARGVDVVRVDDRGLVFDLAQRSFPDVDIVLDRGLVHSRAEYTLRLLESWGIPTVNSYRATITCDNKFLTSVSLIEAGVPTLRTMLAYTPESALEAIEQLGYPAVLKPNTGSWGRLLAKINDRDAAEAVLEHKEVLGSYHHSIFYVQEYVKKPGRDIRAFVIGDTVMAASYRNSGHWITNTARGGESTACPITPEIEDIALRSAATVGADIAGVDLVETNDGLKVIEINVGAEFHGLIETTDRDIPAEIVGYLVDKAENVSVAERNEEPAASMVSSRPMTKQEKLEWAKSLAREHRYLNRHQISGIVRLSDNTLKRYNIPWEYTDFELGQRIPDDVWYARTGRALPAHMQLKQQRDS